MGALRRGRAPARRVLSESALLWGALLWGALLWGAGPLPGLSGPAWGQAGESTLTLSLSGPEGTSYQGHCDISRPGGDEELELSGEVPEDLSFEGDGLKCTLRSEGRLTVEARKDDGNVSRSTTSGGRVTISIR